MPPGPIASQVYEQRGAPRPRLPRPSRQGGGVQLVVFAAVASDVRPSALCSDAGEGVAGPSTGSSYTGMTSGGGRVAEECLTGVKGESRSHIRWEHRVFGEGVIGIIFHHVQEVVRF